MRKKVVLHLFVCLMCFVVFLSGCLGNTPSEITPFLTLTGADSGSGTNADPWKLAMKEAEERTLTLTVQNSETAPLATADGNILEVALSNGTLVISAKSVGIATVTLTVGNKLTCYLRVTVSAASWLYLSEFAPDSGETGLGGSNMIAVNGGLSVSGDTSELWLSSGDATGDEYVDNRWAFAQKFEKGVSVQAPGEVVYDITDMNATRFTCYFGTNAKCSSGLGTVGVQIFTNNSQEPIYSLNSQEDAEALGVAKFPVGQYDNYVKIDVKIPDRAKQLILKPTDGGDGAESDHAIFADAKLYANYANLSDLKGYDVSTGWDTVRYDQTPDGSLTLRTLYQVNDNAKGCYARNLSYDKGLFLHATSSITFDITGMGVKRFTSFYGISELQSNYTPTAVFKVFFDGEEAFSGWKTRGKINVGIGNNIDLFVPRGTKTITLTTEADSASTNDGNHTIWVCPRLFGTNMTKEREIEAELNKDALLVGESTELAVSAVDYRNVRTELFADQYTVTSVTPDILSCDGRTVTALKAGKGKISVAYKDFRQDIDIITYGKDSAWKVTSPNGNSVIKLLLADGTLSYTAEKNGVAYVKSSELGLVTSLGTFTQEFSLASVDEIVEIDETYDPVTGKYSLYRNHCNEQTVTLSCAGISTQLKVIVRAYDDGVAFRYAVVTNKSFTISDEYSRLNVPADTFVCYQPNISGKYPDTHEQLFESGKMRKFTADFTLPFYYNTRGIDVVVSEADLDGTYCGGILQSVSETSLKFGFPEQQSKGYFGNSSVEVTGNFYSPWRAFIAGDAETIFLSTMMENLSDACVLDDTSWVEPGITSWSWMSGINSGGNPYDYQASEQTMRDQIDLTAEMGWQYYILDEGWMKRISNAEAKAQGLTGGRDWLPWGGWYIGFYDFMPDIVAYANSKNVGLIGWVHVAQLNDPANDYKQMDDLFRQFSELGLKGVKADFFNNESQLTIELCNKVYEKLAKYRLIGNIHGANKPTGERRTYPNIVNREAIYGEERNNTQMSQMAIQAYVRGVVGPTDLTPYIYPMGGSNTTQAAQMAFGVIYESGMTCFAGSISQFRSLTPEIKQYYYAYPSNWADSRFLNGKICDGMSVARKAEDGRWYLGGINVTASTQVLTLDFLDEDTEYIAYIYTDAANGVNYARQTVRKGGTITVSTFTNGGFAIKIVKKSAQLTVVNNGEKGSVSVFNGSKTVNRILPEAGTMLDIEVDCRAGDSVNYVIWNGRKLYLTDNKVTVMSTGGDNKLEVVYE